MNVGKLDRKVTIQVLSLADDGYGNDQTESWSNYLTDVPMQIIHPNVRDTESAQGSQMVSMDTPVFRGRYDSVPLPKTHRIVYGSENYYITGKIEIGRRQGMDLATEKRDNE